MEVSDSILVVDTSYTLVFGFPCLLLQTIYMTAPYNRQTLLLTLFTVVMYNKLQRTHDSTFVNTVAFFASASRFATEGFVRLHFMFV